MKINHDLILDIIFKNKGYVAGGYAREWILNKSPSDFGWKDIDILCNKEKENIIKKEISKIYPNLNLDFRINLDFGLGFKCFYSLNLFCFKDKNEFLLRDDRNCSETIKKWYKDYHDLLIEKTKKQICIYSFNSDINRHIKFEEYIKSKGWVIEYPFIECNK